MQTLPTTIKQNELKSLQKLISHEVKKQHKDFSEKKPRYGNYDEKKLLRVIYTLAALKDNPKLRETDFLADIERSYRFVTRAFDEFDGRKLPETQADFVFSVPTRITRGDDRYISEVIPFLPMMKYVDADLQQRLVACLPPCVIESYGSDHSRIRGNIVFTPIFTDMINDYRFRLSALRDATKIINDTANFSQEKLGAKVIGLGAIIPKLTKFGRSIKRPGLVTTTGHGGTVYLIEETLKKVLEVNPIKSDGKIGVIGAGGSIGRSTVSLLLEDFPEKELVLFDFHPKRLKSVAQYCQDVAPGQKIKVVDSSISVLKESDIIISAVTRPIDLDIHGKGLSLENKVIIDDSQPGCFDRGQVENRGGNIVWVVGHDNSKDAIVTRVGGYKFGTESGLMQTDDVWGCEAEAATLALTKRYDKAISQAVTPEMAKSVGKLMKESGIKTAGFQSFGQPVTLPKAGTKR